MQEIRDNIISTINKARDEIISIKSDIDSNKQVVEEIKDLIARLKQIEVALKPRQRWFKEKIDSLDLILKELLEMRFNIMLDTTHKMFEIIGKNLIDGMYLEEKEENLMDLMFNQERIGSIEVIEDYKPDIKIRVTVFENFDDFDVNEPCRMYSIISFINTKFNYKEI
jgi:sugar-specific transcriptional regulator TrmB